MRAYIFADLSLVLTEAKHKTMQYGTPIHANTDEEKKKRPNATAVHVSRNPQAHKPAHLLATGDTAPEIVHCKTNPAIFADTQTATGPSDDGARVGLADDAGRAVRQTRCASFPGGGVDGFFLCAPGEDEAFEHYGFFFGSGFVFACGGLRG